jgi:hypothetical protein
MELGNYGGYQLFSYGAIHIIKTSLEEMGAKQFYIPLSMDSLPKKDWRILKYWCAKLNEKYHEYRLCDTRTVENKSRQTILL